MRNDNGFTLIELLISMVIVSILAAISVMNFSNYRRTVNHMTAKLYAKDLITSYNAIFIDVQNEETEQYQVLKYPGEPVQITGSDKSIDQLLPGVRFSERARYSILVDTRCLNQPSSGGINCTTISMSVAPCDGIIVRKSAIDPIEQRNWFYAEVHIAGGGPTKMNLHDNAYSLPVECT